jgi:hypothetical protein
MNVRTNPVVLITTFVAISAQSFHITATINQMYPPVARISGPTGYKSGKPALNTVPTIRVAVATHFKT